MKKLVSLIMVVMLVLAIAVPAMADADKPHNLIINNASPNQHSYIAYQIFAGDYDEDLGLSNITWGSGVKGEELLAELVELDAFEDCEDAVDVAAVLEDFTIAQAEEFADIVAKHLNAAAGTSTAAEATAGYTYTIPVTGDGYYFIKDVDASLDDIEGDSYTDFILQVVGDVEVTAKSGTVEVKKEVATGGYACGLEAGKETEDEPNGHVHSIDKCGLVYADDCTNQIGDAVPFKLESTVPAEAAAYDYYYFIFGDTLSNGLDLDKDTIKVYIGEDLAKEDDDYTISDDYKDYTFAVALVDAKTNAGKTVTVTYDAILNENAVVGVGGETNEVVVEFSKDPNKEYKGDGENGFPAEGDVTPDGETPKDINKDFTTEINLLKVDGKDETKTLAGAVFTITGTTESVVVRTEDVYTEDENGTYYKLVSGEIPVYTTDAPVAEHMEAQNNRADGGYVECEATDPAVKYHIGDKYYRVAKESEIADNTIALFIHISSNESLYDSTEKKYTKSSQTVNECKPEEFSFSGETDKDGKLAITGLNAGTYTITEIKQPDGYNLLEAPITVNIECNLPTVITDGTETCTWTYTDAGDNNIGTVLDDGTVEITVINNQGAELPETGGIGTTIFYVVGSVLLLGAAILLITKKRMSAHN